jgi:formylglycine-generating enzyme required for sulfatase activity
LSLDADQQLLILTTAPVSEALQKTVPTGGVLLRAKDWTGLEQALWFQGVRPVARVWPSLQVAAGDAGQSLLGGIGGGCLPVETTDKNGMKFVRLCPGSFLMGSDDGDKDEQPIHKVEIAEFAIGKYEVTFEQYDRFAKATKRKQPEDQGWGRKQQPAINVTWDDAKAFCEHYGHRLPTEAEWEYAARAGTKTRYSFEDDAGKLGEYAWYDKNADSRTHPVGQKKANPWGLHDMHGNVWEWVQDCYHNSYQHAPVDGGAWEGGDYCQMRRVWRVLRGGSFAYWTEILRSTIRSRDWIEGRDGDNGFRCVMGPPRRRPFWSLFFDFFFSL